MARAAAAPELGEQLVAEVLEQSAVVVTLVDPPGDGTRARWYSVGLQPALDGGMDVVRQWGRLPVGDHPRRLVSCHPGIAEASATVRAVVGRRLLRGYRPRPRLTVPVRAELPWGPM